MPELPEVHTIISDLKKHILNSVITDVKVSKDFKVSPEPSVFKEILKNKGITNVRRIAKNIVIKLKSENTVIIHLGMTGQLLLRKKDHPSDKWTHVILVLEKDGKTAELRYADMRMFGKISVINDKDINEIENNYGPDPLTNTPNQEEFYKRLHSKHTNIKNILLDQKVIAGVGNIYANDALWAAKIHPETKTKDITPAMASNLLSSIIEVLEESIENRGTTLKDKMYVDIFGKFGKHQDYLKIYGKEECPRCHVPTTFKKISGRGAYYCENCQEKSAQTRLL